jgi:hypothetical protein
VVERSLDRAFPVIANAVYYTCFRVKLRSPIMVRSIAAHYDGASIVPDEPLPLQPGQRLRVQIELVEPAPPRFAELLALASDLPDAPADLSAQHDHYLYGTPKR